MQELLEISKKYNVEIDFRIKRNGIMSIVENHQETRLIKNGFIKNHLEELEQVAKQMHQKELQYNKEVNKRLESFE